MRKLGLLLGLLMSMCSHAQQEAHPSQKLSYSLREIAFRSRGNDSLLVSLSFLPGSKISGNDRLFRLIQIREDLHCCVLKISGKDLTELASRSNVLFISEVQAAKEELTTGAYDLTLNRINYVHARWPQWSGDSLQVSVKERLFDTADIDLKGRVFKTGWEASQRTDHASLMATIIGGAANSSPFARGSARKSRLTSSSFQNLFPDADSVFQFYGIRVQNHSYGTTVENFYGNEASAYDAQANHFPQLLHVFSAGNSGDLTNVSGPYAGIAAVANLTGNFKQAKNIVTVGSVDSSGQMLPLSSRGPAFDGRVKPELVAYGEDGSSGAAALVSGTALLLQDAYRSAHNGQLPSASLLKACLLNGADDWGAPNVNYQSGYGSLNAYKALAAISEGRFMEAAIVQNETKAFPLFVPAGAAKLKITLVWNDPAATPNATKALVNDIDMQLKFPAAGSSWLPWVLDPGLSAVAGQLPAQRKRDTLNNVEQITLDAPAAGNYTIELQGSKINGTAQPFAIAYQIDTSNLFYWTYPAGGDHLLSHNTHWLRWETNRQGQAQIEYATNGNNWRQAGIVPDVSKKYFRWALPDTVTNAVVRMNFSNASFISDSFTISPQLNLRTGFNCTDSFLLYWNALPPNSYRLYELGSRYLESFAQPSDTAIVLTKLQHPSIFYAVAPVIQGREGIRSNTINYTTLGVGCYIKSFFLQSQNSGAAFFRGELGTLFRVEQVSLERIGLAGNSTIMTIVHPQSTLLDFTDASLSQGENRYRMKLVLTDGTILYSNIELVYYLPSTPVLLYPNPVGQPTQLKILTLESGRYRLQMIDGGGRLVMEQMLNSTLSLINTGSYARGLYLMRILDRDGKPSTQKLVIY